MSKIRNARLKNKYKQFFSDFDFNASQITKDFIYDNYLTQLYDELEKVINRDKVMLANYEIVRLHLVKVARSLHRAHIKLEQDLLNNIKNIK